MIEKNIPELVRDVAAVAPAVLVLVEVGAVWIVIRTNEYKKNVNKTILIFLTFLFLENKRINRRSKFSFMERKNEKWMIGDQTSDGCCGKNWSEPVNFFCAEETKKKTI